MTHVVWIGVFLLTLGTLGCEGRSNVIDYRGEKIKLTKAYADYADYKNDPKNIHPSETERVQALVLGAPIAKTFSSRLEASKAVGQIVFPGYRGGGFVDQSQADGTVLMGFRSRSHERARHGTSFFKAWTGCTRYSTILFSRIPQGCFEVSLVEAAISSSPRSTGQRRWFVPTRPTSCRGWRFCR